jgi:hypothetical protein
MRKYLAIAAAAALATVATAATAEDVAAVSTAAAVAPKVGQTVVSSDGRTLGRIDRVDAQRVGVIVDMKYVYLPSASLSAGTKGRLVTSLTAKQALYR